MDPVTAMIILGGAGALKGGMQAQQAREQQEQLDAQRAAIIKYSPWTGMQDPGYTDTGNKDFTSGILGGAMQGAGMGAMVSKLGGGGGAAGGVEGVAADPAVASMDRQLAAYQGKVVPGNAAINFAPASAGAYGGSGWSLLTPGRV